MVLIVPFKPFLPFKQNKGIKKLFYKFQFLEFSGGCFRHSVLSAGSRIPSHQQFLLLMPVPNVLIILCLSTVCTSGVSLAAMFCKHCHRLPKGVFFPPPAQQLGPVGHSKRIPFRFGLLEQEFFEGQGKKECSVLIARAKGISNSATRYPDSIKKRNPYFQ